ncbi:MAG TPA: replicative DNA helicase, partial [Candidatus Dormibacteraeota bacterium]|nr:replicative DNA helicase [Candidatus Dormibacteraeota bacterium]
MIPGVKTEGRLPPHDLEAEASVLGAILLDQTAITRILDIIDPDDFYRENHGQIYRAAMQLFREGEPIDNVTLAAELEKMGVLERVGGRAHLAMLQEQTPTAANVEHYARIVRDRSYKRRLISAGTQVSTYGYDDSLEAGEAVNQAQACVYSITDDQVNSGMERLYDLLKPAMDRIDAQMASGGGVVGLASGFTDLDRMTNGFKPSDMVVVAGRPSMGKALSLDTPIPTPTGWTTMGALRIGDQIFDDAGLPCTVVAATPVQLDRRCFTVAFDDGEQITADADHRWAVLVGGKRERRVLTTLEMASTLGRASAYCIPACRALAYPERGLPADPYAFGGRLGDGAEIAAMVGAAHATTGPAMAGSALRERGPRIPRQFQESGVAQRLDLLRGLMDAAATSDQVGPAEYVTGVAELAEDVMELARGLGLTPRMSLTWDGADGSARHRITLGTPGGAAERTIAAIRPISSVPVRCIQVDSPNHLYLAGRGCVATHNTSFVLNLALTAAVEQKQPIAIFSLEMSKEQLVERMLCEQARIDAQRLHKGLLSEAEHERLVYALGPLGDAPIYIDDSPMLDDLTLRLKARQAKAREGIEMIMIDYLQLMHGRSRSDEGNRVQEVSAISRALKSIARELRVPVIAISQLSRAPEQRPDKRPILSDLRESGCMPAETRLLRADNGQEVTLGELVLTQEQPLVWSLGNNGKLVPRRLTRTFPSGVKPVFRLRLASGYELEATANHPFRTADGWRRLDELSLGQPIAVPGRLRAPVVQGRWDHDELVILAHLLGSGTAGPEVAQTGSGPRRNLEHPLQGWLESLGLWRRPREAVFIPEPVFGLPEEQIALLLRHLWAVAGSLVVDGDAEGQEVRIALSSPSRALADGVRRALLRLQITTRLTAEASYRSPGWRVEVTEPECMVRFLSVVRCHAEQTRLIPECLALLADRVPAPAPEARQLAAAAVTGWGDETWPVAEGRRGVFIGETELVALSVSDVRWDEVVEITALGPKPTFDATVEDTHNFIANGVVAHNSIEQDADLVIFLYRDEYYNREKSEKPGIA